MPQNTGKSDSVAAATLPVGMLDDVQIQPHTVLVHSKGGLQMLEEKCHCVSSG